MSGYPIWRYHESKLPEGKIVYSKEEDEALGSGWVHSTADFGKAEEPAKSAVEAPEIEAPGVEVEESEKPKAKVKRKAKGGQ